MNIDRYIFYLNLICEYLTSYPDYSITGVGILCYIIYAILQYCTNDTKELETKFDNSE